MPSQGPRAPGTVADDASVGDKSWSGTSVTASDDSYASVGYNGPSEYGAHTTHYLKCTNFGFTIPADAQVTGVAVYSERHEEVSIGGQSVGDGPVRLVKGGTISGNDLGGSGEWPSSDATWTFGGSSQMWGLSLTPADVNASTFGVALAGSVFLTSHFGDFQDNAYCKVDAITITVYYTLRPGAGLVRGVAVSRAASR